MKYLSNFKTFEENKSIVQMDKLDDVYNYVQSGCFGILSAFKNNATPEQNSKHTIELKKILNQFNPIKIIGQWNSETPEISFIIQKPKNINCTKFEQELKKISDHFNQEAFIFSRDGDVILHHHDDSITDINDHFKIADKYFSFKFD